jgi:hypothetical protein
LLKVVADANDPPRLLDRSPLHQKSGLSACGIGWRFSLK